LAKRLKVRVGDVLPPFSHSRSGDRLVAVVGVFRPAAPHWTARWVVALLEPAMRMTDHPNAVSEIQIWCPSDEMAKLSGLISALVLPGTQRLFVSTSRSRLSHSEGELDRRASFLSIHLILALLCAIWVVMVTSGAGMTERIREIGLLKATGWATDEILIRALSESIVIGFIAYGAAFVLAVAGLQFVKGWGLAPLYVTGLDLASPVRLPYALSPLLLVLTAVATVAVTLTGTLYSAWRAAVTSPMRAMRE
jgi:ABC-type lipoprotein release transport system permease subunit